MKITIETLRLELREFDAKDSENLFFLNADPEVTRYTGDGPFESIEEATRFVLNYNHYCRHGYGRWVMTLKDSGEFIGWCGLRYNANTNEVDLGFRILRKHWSQGYATEAALASINYAFNTLGLPGLIGRAMNENKVSIHLLKKLGMEFEKTFTENGKTWSQFKLKAPG